MLFDLQSPINLGMILRVAETYQAEVQVFDPRGIFADRQRWQTISDFACGALQRLPPRIIRDRGELSGVVGSGRLIATTVEHDAVALPDLAWQADDIVALGNEYDGLPADFDEAALLRLHIPMPEGYAPKPPSFHPIDDTRTVPVARDGQPNLNVAMTAGIVLYSAYLFRRRR